MLAAADLTFDFLACWAAVALVGVVLLTGWLTRTTAVVWVSVVLAGLAASVLGTWMAYRLDASEDPIARELVVLRLIGGIGGVLLVLAVWALVKLRRRDVVMRPTAKPLTVPAKPPIVKYDRQWLLSLLQERARSAKERVATPTGSENRPEMTAPPTGRDKPHN
ncbi:MAG TPA: hypothetical protein VF170_03125 [Planctomycetaceae bacterium]